MKSVRLFQIGLASGGLLIVSAISMFGFVPSCEKELATLYPPALKADLSACATPRPAIKPTAAADLSRFAKRLNGTWELKMRTIQGITSDTRQLSARLYFDLAPGAGPQLAGGALLLEHPKEELIQRVAAARRFSALAFWDLAVTQKGKMALSFAMSENAGGKYPGGIVRTVRDATFSELDSVFVSLDRQSPKAEAWDRVIVSENALVYLSCQRGVIERYAKVSGQKPEVEGLNVRAFWRKQLTAPLTASNTFPNFNK